MRHSEDIGQDTYESLSDIVLASVGIFVVFFVISVLFLGRDQIVRLAKITSLQKEVTDVEQQLVDLEEQRRRKVEEVRSEIERNGQILDQEVLTAKERNNEERRRQEVLSQQLTAHGVVVDDTIDIEELRVLLEQVKLTRNKSAKETNAVKLRANNVRQEFNKYVELEDAKPFLLIQPVDFLGRRRIALTAGTSITLDQFRAVLETINAGSGFTFRIRERGPAPAWLNVMLIEEGWFPILDLTPIPVEEGWPPID